MKSYNTTKSHAGFSHYWKSIFAFLLLFASTSLFAQLQSEEVSYTDGETEMIGYLVWDDKFKGKRPGIIVVHEWWGLNSYPRERAEQLAKLGYTALAMDIYGEGKVADHPKEAKKFATMVAKNLPNAKARFEAAMKVLSEHPTVGNDKLSAIGYCFGGGIVLNMARMGLPLKGVASFHGSLAAATKIKGKVDTKIAVFNGKDDPYISGQQVERFRDEMNSNDVDFELHNYKRTVHSFTNPAADQVAEKFNLTGIGYNEKSDKDSWKRMQFFLKELYK